MFSQRHISWVGGKLLFGAIIFLVVLVIRLFGESFENSQRLPAKEVKGWLVVHASEGGTGASNFIFQVEDEVEGQLKVIYKKGPYANDYMNESMGRVSEKASDTSRDRWFPYMELSAGMPLAQAKYVLERKEGVKVLGGNDGRISFTETYERIESSRIKSVTTNRHASWSENGRYIETKGMSSKFDKVTTTNSFERSREALFTDGILDFVKDYGEKKLRPARY